MADWIGWVATATFASSYFCKRPATLRRVQGLAALLWLTYGLLIHALPVIVANVVVAALAIFSSFRPAESGSARLPRPRVAEPLPSDEG
jgi:hypothetical protein